MDTTETEYHHADAIHVAADPERVFDAVADVTRHGEWSLFTVRAVWDEGDGPRPGARFTGFNERPGRVWETRSEVVAAERGREFAWEVNDGLVRWGYTMEPDGEGTRLTQSWHFRPAGLAFIRERYGDDGDAQIALRVDDARRSIPETLARIKEILER